MNATLNIGQTIGDFRVEEFVKLCIFAFCILQIYTYTEKGNTVLHNCGTVFSLYRSEVVWPQTFRKVFLR